MLKVTEYAALKRTKELDYDHSFYCIVFSVQSKIEFIRCIRKMLQNEKKLWNLKIDKALTWLLIIRIQFKNLYKW